jgi:hypothetical protein
MLTDDQFNAFHDKFVPVDSVATAVRDANAQKLEDAKIAAALTREQVDSNKPLDPKVAQAVAAVNAAKNR